MKALKLLFVAFTLLVFQPFILSGQENEGKKTVVEHGSDDPDSKQKARKPELKTILLPLCNHLNLPMEIDREQLIQRYNEMIDEIDRKFHAPTSSVRESKAVSMAVTTPEKENE